MEDNICPCCRREVETTLHVIWNCPAAQDVWGGGSILFQKSYFMGDNFMQFMEYSMDRFSKEDVGLLATIARRIWLRRNKFIFENLFTPPQVVYKEASDAYSDYCRVHLQEEHGGHIREVTEPHVALTDWQPPPNGIIKVNWDASLNMKDRYVGIGIVARDHSGNFMGARAITKKVIGSPTLAETMATLEAVLFCKECGFFEVILEGDAKQVVNDVNAGKTDLSAAGLFVDDILSELKGLRYVKVAHIGRNSNNVAHVLAKEASAKFLDMAWLEDVPDFLVYAVNRDRLYP